MASPIILDPSISDLDEKLDALLVERVKLLLKLEDVNKRIDAVLLSREHLEVAADEMEEPEAKT